MATDVMSELTRKTLPLMFLSHGAPDVLLKDPYVVERWVNEAMMIARPKAILSITAHWETREFTVSANKKSETIYDFSGFDPRLYRYQYAPPGAVELAEEVVGLTGCARNDSRGLDHGSWIPLMAMYPSANIPVAQLSVSPDTSVEEHFRMGKKLAGLASEEVLIIGSGSIIHNLRKLDWRDMNAPPEDWSVTVLDRIMQSILNNDLAALSEMTENPFFKQAHPTIEHILPLYILTAIALERGWEAESIIEVWRYSNLSMHGVKWSQDNG